MRLVIQTDVNGKHSTRQRIDQPPEINTSVAPFEISKCAESTQMRKTGSLRPHDQFWLVIWGTLRRNARVRRVARILPPERGMIKTAEYTACPRKGP